MIHKAYKFRMYPNKEQKTSLEKHFGCVRFIYNYGLNYSNEQYKLNKKSFSWLEIANNIPKLKSNEKTKWLKEVNSQSLQSSLRNLDSAYTRFFKRQGKFPQFKKKRNQQSFQVPQNFKINKHNSTLSIPKTKGEIKVVFHREIIGKINFCTISRNSANQYFVSFTVEIDKKIVKKEIKKETAIGIDLGIKDFAVLSNKTKIPNPNISKNKEIRLGVLQSRVSRKVKGSKNRIKAILKLNKLHQKIKNKKNDFLHKLSSKIISENQTICLEDLNVSGMMKNRKLSKAIHYCSWNEFIRQLEYKGEWNGNNILKINRFSPSSKMCCNCGCINEELKLSDRTWKCKKCGIIHDRDFNASINIVDFAFHPKAFLLGAERSEEPTEKLASVNSFRKKRVSKLVHGSRKP